MVTVTAGALVSVPTELAFEDEDDDGEDDDDSPRLSGSRDSDIGRGGLRIGRGGMKLTGTTSGASGLD